MHFQIFSSANPSILHTLYMIMYVTLVSRTGHSQEDKNRPAIVLLVTLCFSFSCNVMGNIIQFNISGHWNCIRNKFKSCTYYNFKHKNSMPTNINHWKRCLRKAKLWGLMKAELFWLIRFDCMSICHIHVYTHTPSFFSVKILVIHITTLNVQLLEWSYDVLLNS